MGMAHKVSPLSICMLVHDRPLSQELTQHLHLSILKVGRSGLCLEVSLAITPTAAHSVEITQDSVDSFHRPAYSSHHRHAHHSPLSTHRHTGYTGAFVPVFSNKQPHIQEKNPLINPSPNPKKPKPTNQTYKNQTKTKKSSSSKRTK